MLKFDFFYLLEQIPKLVPYLDVTFLVLILTLFFGTILGFVLAVWKLGKSLILRKVAYAFTTAMRCTPSIVLLFLVYYGLAQFDAVKQGPLWPYLREPYWCALIAMTMHTAAYIAEIIRGAIQAVPPGEVEAARSLGMSRAQTMWHIILPRAARIGLPAYSNEVILMLKASSLASTITLLELTGMARTIIARTYLPVEIFFAAGLFYLAMTFILVQVFRWLERKLRVDALQGR